MSQTVTITLSRAAAEAMHADLQAAIAWVEARSRADAAQPTLTEYFAAFPHLKEAGDAYAGALAAGPAACLEQAMAACQARGWGLTLYAMPGERPAAKLWPKGRAALLATGATATEAIHVAVAAADGR